MLLKTRSATNEDIPSIVKVRTGAITENEIRGFSAPEYTIKYTSSQELRKVWGQGNQLKDGFEVFVVEDQEDTIGFIVFKVERDFGYIDNIVVSKDKRKKGIGQALVTYTENLANPTTVTLGKLTLQKTQRAFLGKLTVSG